MIVSNKVDIFKNTYTLKIIFTIGSILLIKNIKADMSIIFHFYDLQNQQECNLNCNKEEKMQFSNFIKQRYNCYEHEECIQCTRYIIKDPSELILNLDDNKCNENNEKKIYICTDVCKYEDFLYFLKILNEINDIKENLQVDDFILLIHILDMFKFKKDKKFKQIIRIILLSIIYNCQKNYNKGDLTKKNYISSSLFNCILYEFRKIYFFDLKPNFDKEERVSGEHIKNLIVENFDENFCSGKTYVSIKSEFLIKLSKYIKYNKEFKHNFKNIFKWIKPLRVTFDSINSTSDLSMLLPLIYFIPGEELCFQSWKNAVQLQYILENFGFEKIKTLFFIDCNFLSFYESYFESFRSLKCIYLLDSWLLNATASEKTENLIHNLVSIISNEIENKTDASKLEKLNTKDLFKKNFLNWDKSLAFNENFLIQNMFNSSKYMIHFSNTLSISLPSATFKVAILNLQRIFRIDIFLDQNFFIDLNLESMYVSKNVKSLEIKWVDLTDIFLCSVLSLSNLKKVSIFASKFIQKNYETKYMKHISMQELVITHSILIYPERIFKFINSMPNLKKLQISYNTTDIFKHIFNFNMIELVHLEVFIFQQCGECTSGFPKFTNKNSIINLNISYDFSGSLLYYLFIHKELQNIQILELSRFTISKSDRNSMGSCTKIKDITIIGCRLSGISFFEIFDIKKEYAIKRVTLKDMVLGIHDIIFISNLKHLRFLTLNYTYFTPNFFVVSQLVSPSYSKINMGINVNLKFLRFKYRLDEFFST
ncbi:hypothetical protein CWI36_0584p0010 [Hamiltosporidium magnivora]|uniref:Leucine-rich repeat-containing protein n=3 Tax=Hamiltosporidium magnivora TaxID=148818 RepID=A0A4Q9LCU7_9MICR|nr:hypothetical protein CWI36_0584p0010 [Hamiltosporidium magnivora]